MKNIFDRMATDAEVLSEENAEHSEDSSQPLTTQTTGAGTTGAETTGAGTTDADTTNDQPTETTASTPSDVKELTQELLKHGYLEEARKPAMFQRALVRQQEIMAALEPLDLVLRLDSHRGVAFLKVAETAYALSDDSSADQGVTPESGAWTHPLVRRQRLTLEQSLLIAILRQAFVLHEQELGIGHSDAKIPLDELLPQFLTYFDDSGSDTKNESRLANLLDQLKTYGIVSEIDKNQEVAIRPLIAHLANPESLTALLQAFREQAQASASAELANGSAEIES